MESQLEHVLREMEAQAEELRTSSGEWKAAGLLAKYKEAQGVLGALDERICKLRAMQGGAVPAGTKAASCKATGEACSTRQQREEPGSGTVPSAEPQRADAVSPGTTALPSQACEGHMTSAHGWRVTLAAPEILDASKVQVEQVGGRLEVSFGGAVPPQHYIDIPSGMDTAAIRVKFSRKQRTLTITVPRLSFPATAKACVAKLGEQMHAVVDGFLENRVADELLAWVRKQHADSVLKPGEVEGGLRAKTRGDLMAWVSPREVGGPLQAYAARLDDLLLEMAESCEELASSTLVRDKAMVTVYPGNGARYVKHFDNANSANRSRVLTCIIYLNPEWRPEHGGQLRVYPKGADKPKDIQPLHNRLGLFWSDHRAPHEVMPSHRERFAVSFWFHNGTVMQELHASADGESVA